MIQILKFQVISLVHPSCCVLTEPLSAYRGLNLFWSRWFRFPGPFFFNCFIHLYLLVVKYKIRLPNQLWIHVYSFNPTIIFWFPWQKRISPYLKHIKLVLNLIGVGRAISEIWNRSPPVAKMSAFSVWPRVFSSCPEYVYSQPESLTCRIQILLDKIWFLPSWNVGERWVNLCLYSEEVTWSFFFR